MRSLRPSPETTRRREVDCGWRGKARLRSGVFGLRPLNEAECELKRLYVQPQGRGLGLGRGLTDNAIRFAKNAGYRSMKLDTISEQMAAAERMYLHLGFRRVDAYYTNPVAGAAFYALDLSRSA